MSGVSWTVEPGTAGGGGRPRSLAAAIAERVAREAVEGVGDTTDPKEPEPEPM